MDKVQAALFFKPAAPTQPRSAIQGGQQPRVDLPTSTNKFGLTISAEAQYLFEMDKYLSALDQTAQDKALGYLSTSDDPLHGKAADSFIKAREVLGEDRALVLDRTGSEKLRKLLNTGLEINGSTEIAVIPMATKVFRLDGNETFHPVRLDYRNDTLNHQLDVVERTAYNVLGNQDAANLFGSVRNAISASENILSSFDDVLHYNYSIEKARTAIDFIDAPESVASALTKLLSQSVAYQDYKQSRFIDDTSGFVNDSRVSQIAREDVRLGTAAQLYNHQLQSSLDTTGLSVLNARATAAQLLTQHPDLIRFYPNKLDEAFEFYEKDFENFKRALNKEFNVPVKGNEIEIDSTLLDVGRDYAASVIGKVESYLK